MPKYEAEKGDRGFVYLDGVKIQNVLECDTDAGYLIKMKRDENGEIVTEADGDSIVMERLTGVVTFKSLDLPKLPLERKTPC